MEKLLAPTTQINLWEVEGSVMMLREQVHFSAKLFDNAVTKKPSPMGTPSINPKAT